MGFNYYSSHSATIVNYGTFTTTGWQNFGGYIENRGSVKINGYANFTKDSYTNNYNEFEVNNGGTFEGNIDNLGSVKFNGVNINGEINNYKQMFFYSFLIVGDGTYITNDTGAMFETVDINAVEFNGPMLTNNGTINIKSTSNSAGFKMNKSVNQVFNNGLINVEGEFQLNAVGSLLNNNCRIVSKSFKIQAGTVQNYGLISLTNDFYNSGEECFLTNNATGRIQGTNFTNSGYINGSGEFYFTGETRNDVDTNSNKFAGTSPDQPIRFYDASLASGSAIFDNVQTSNPWNMPINTIRPDFMQPMGVDDFNCGEIPPSYAGYPPTTLPLEYEGSTETVNFPLDKNAFPHDDVDGFPFHLVYSSLKLFDYNNPDNPTNNSEHLIIPGKGEFTVNTTTREIVFTPDPAFKSGVVEAEYRISNSWENFPNITPGPRTLIKVIFESNCYKEPNLEPALSEPTSVGISTLSTPSKGWPQKIPNGFIALESKNKGFVITRVANDRQIADPKEGMLIYDLEDRCIKLFNGTSWNCIQRNCN